MSQFGSVDDVGVPSLRRESTVDVVAQSSGGRRRWPALVDALCAARVPHRHRRGPLTRRGIVHWRRTDDARAIGGSWEKSTRGTAARDPALRAGDVTSSPMYADHTGGGLSEIFDARTGRACWTTLRRRMPPKRLVRELTNSGYGDPHPPRLWHADRNEDGWHAARAEDGLDGIVQQSPARARQRRGTAGQHLEVAGRYLVARVLVKLRSGETRSARDSAADRRSARRRSRSGSRIARSRSSRHRRAHGAER